MSKKHKNKFKKMQKARIIQESMKNPVVESTDTELVREAKSENLVASVVGRKNKQIASEMIKDEFLPEVSIVKKELKKIAIVFGIIIVLIAVITILDSKTNLVLNFADHISKIYKK